MRGDEAQPQTEGSAPRARTGPRHAAPRKSLLTRAPVGKAIALAAMPTAVLMGMGLTPRLAQADELPKNPFSGDHCVSQSDSPSPSSSPSASPSATPSASPSATPSPTSASPSAKAAAPNSGQSNGGSASGGTSQTTTSGSSAAQPTASPTPSPTQSKNPLDPLGLGNTLKGLLGGGSTTSSTPSVSPTTSATPTPSSSPTAKAPASAAGSAVQGTTDAVKNAVASAAKEAKSATPTASPSDSPSAAPSPSSTGPQPFPCPTYNAKALADAGLEPTPSLLPNQPWILKTDLLTLMGLDYKGIVKVKTANGTVKDVLKFTSTAVDIKNLHQITEGPQGAHWNVQARDGSTSTMRNGTVTMYTEKISGNLFGLIPVTFSPQSPPPLNIPLAIFSNCTVTQAGQFGGTLTIPGMHVYRS